MTSGKKLLTVGLVLVLILMLQIAALGEDKTPKNSFRFDCPGQIDVPQKDTVVGITGYLTTDQNVGGFSLGFKFDGDGIMIKEVKPAETLPKAGQFIANIDSTKNEVLIGWVDFTGRMPIEKGEDIEAFTIMFGVPKGTKAQQVNIDSTFIAPAGHWVLSMKDGDSQSPAYIDCGDAEIIIGKPAMKKEE